MTAGRAEGAAAAAVQQPVRVRVAGSGPAEEGAGGEEQQGKRPQRRQEVEERRRAGLLATQA